jgi:RimJ/RimL family protein N-acetyltransferase
MIIGEVCKVIKGKNIYLRTIEKSDIETIWEWNNDPAVTLFSQSNPYASLSKEQMINSYFSNNSKIIYAICTLEGELIGEISYWFPNKLFKSTVEGGTVIGKKEYQKTGVGFEACMLMTRVVFNDKRINRISIVISDHNFMSKIPLEKALVTREGVIRKDRFIDGQYYDTIIYGILREDYIKLHNDFAKFI